jgi:hypothetical protein
VGERAGADYLGWIVAVEWIKYSLSRAYFHHRKENNGIPNTLISDLFIPGDLNKGAYKTLYFCLL